MKTSSQLNKIWASALKFKTWSYSPSDQGHPLLMRFLLFCRFLFMRFDRRHHLLSSVLWLLQSHFASWCLSTFQIISVYAFKSLTSQASCGLSISLTRKEPIWILFVKKKNVKRESKDNEQIRSIENTVWLQHNISCPPKSQSQAISHSSYSDVPDLSPLTYSVSICLKTNQSKC